MMQKSFVKFAYKNDINVNIYLLLKIQQTAVLLLTLISLKAKEVRINEEGVHKL